MKKTFIFTFLFSIVCNLSFTQTRKVADSLQHDKIEVIVKDNGIGIPKNESIDSLKKLLTEAKEDTTRVLLLSQIADDYLRLDIDTALRYAREGLKLAQKIKFKTGEYYNTAAVARCWWGLGDYSAGIQLLLPKVKEVELTRDTFLIIIVFGTLADCYRDQGTYDQALIYHFKSGKFVDKNCTICRIFNTVVASDYLGQKRLDLAQFYISKAFTYQPVHGNEGWPLYIRGQAYAGLQKYDLALFYYRQSIPKLLNEDNLKDLVSVFNSMADLFRSIGLKDSALTYAHKALSVALSKRFAKEAMEAYLQLSSSYELSNTDSALHYYKLAIAAKDILYNQEKQRQILSYQFDEQLHQQQIESAEAQLKNRIKIYVLLAAVIIFLIVGILLFRNNRHKQKANKLLQHQKEKTENVLKDLRSTQAQLIQQEKMASLGELTAGIAHEIQNPLNFVNNFSEVNDELIGELVDEVDKGNFDDAKAIAADIRQNLEKINQHGKRADAIVKGMLQHSRAATGKKEPTDINALADEYLRLSYHGMRAKDKSFNVTIETDFDNSIGKINLVPQDFGRVLLNLYNNAFYAVTEKKKTASNDYEPTIIVGTKKINDKIEIAVRDNGNGIPKNIIDKIFQPFFTTKPTGQGTGLGLSLAYDIIKANGGEIKVETKEGNGSEFIILLL